MQTKKFSILYSEAKPHQPEAQLHFLTFVPKVLSIADAKELADEIDDVLDHHGEQSAPAPIAAPAIPAPTSVVTATQQAAPVAAQEDDEAEQEEAAEEAEHEDKQADTPVAE